MVNALHYVSFTSPNGMSILARRIFLCLMNSVERLASNFLLPAEVFSNSCAKLVACSTTREAIPSRSRSSTKCMTFTRCAAKHRDFSADRGSSTCRRQLLYAQFGTHLTQYGQATGETLTVKRRLHVRDGLSVAFSQEHCLGRQRVQEQLWSIDLLRSTTVQPHQIPAPPRKLYSCIDFAAHQLTYTPPTESPRFVLRC